MGNNVSSFPILGLPSSVQILVINSLQTNDQIAFSLCSRRTKSMVQFLNLKLGHFQILFSRRIIFTLTLAGYSKFKIVLNWNDVGNLMHSGTPENVELKWEYSTRDQDRQVDSNAMLKWNNELDTQVWINHILDVFNHPTIDEIMLLFDNETIDIKFCAEILKGLHPQLVTLWSAQTIDMMNVVMRSFNSAGRLFLGEQLNVRDEDVIRNLLMQNFNFISAFCYWPEYFSLLNNILVINSKSIHVKNSNLSDKNLNRFLKLWMRGAMPKLQHILFDFPETRIINEEEVLRGIHYIPNSQKRGTFHTVHGPKQQIVRGGFNLRRYDYAVGTVSMKSTRRTFQLFVFDESTAHSTAQ